MLLHTTPFPAREAPMGKWKNPLSFQTSYPYWQLDGQGIQFLNTVRTFRNEKLLRPNPGYNYSPPRRWQQSPSFRDQSTRNSYYRRESPYNSPRPGYHLGSLWLIETDPKTHPYLLDWFYVSGACRVLGNTTDVPTVTVDIDNGQSKDFWMRSFNNEGIPGDSWPNFVDSCVRSHLEASTSSPVFMEQSILRHHDTSAVLPLERNWWARGGPSSAESQQASFLEPPDFGHHGGTQQASFLEPPDFKHRVGTQEGSFLEPPDFNHHNSDDYYDSHSEKSVSDQEQLHWENYHKLSRLTHLGEFGANDGQFKLHFDDIFRTPEPPILRFVPRDSGNDIV